MRLVVTGGGTGGHVFPALEVARLSKAEGWDVLYLGSLRGQEKRSCEKAGIPFVGFPSEPLYSVRQLRGWKAMFHLLRSIPMASKALKQAAPDVIFSTGGYSSAPVMTAARRARRKYVVHEQNSVPGRTNLLVAKKAACIATTFHAAESQFPDCKVVRTGLPVRSELRELAASRKLAIDATPMNILVVGGSQGAAALNEAALATATRMTARDLRWVHVTGRAHFETIFPTYEKLGIGNIYEVKSFLEGGAMAEAYGKASFVVCRSGAGTLSELAAFKLPSVLVPYPAAYANHQYHNAEEFQKIGAAVVIGQDVLHPSNLEEALSDWIDNPARREKAQVALEEWDCPDAARNILAILKDTAGKR